VRRLYGGWFEQLRDLMAAGPGPVVELGAGCGAFKDFMPSVIATDVVATPWADQVVDAERLPWDDGEVANIVMVDVFHHIPEPAAALREAERVLRPGGRMVMCEPYCSPVSRLVYRYLHHEPADMGADPAAVQSSGDDPFDANNALPTLLFWRRPELVGQWTPGLRVIERRRVAWLAYPLSGGFSKPALLPGPVAGPALAVERALNPVMAPFMGFRCIVALERS
jgi:SAM-dependent methyltransferase